MTLRNQHHALLTRIRILEAALAGIDREAEHAFRHPEISFVALRRIAALVQQARDVSDEPVSPTPDERRSLDASP